MEVAGRSRGSFVLKDAIKADMPVAKSKQLVLRLGTTAYTQSYVDQDNGKCL